MISVSISINGVAIYTRTAVKVCKINCERGGQRHQCEYKLDDGSIIKHWYEDGAVKLAHMMLDTIKEA